LHGGAIDRPRPLDGPVDAASDRHVRSEEQ
jgi:hypothetical protein